MKLDVNTVKIVHALGNSNGIIIPITIIKMIIVLIIIQSAT